MMKLSMKLPPAGSVGPARGYKRGGRSRSPSCPELRDQASSSQTLPKSCSKVGCMPWFFTDGAELL